MREPRKAEGEVPAKGEVLKDMEMIVFRSDAKLCKMHGVKLEVKNLLNYVEEHNRSSSWIERYAWATAIS